MIRLANLAELSAHVPNPTLLRCLATLYTRLDTLLTQHQCYCMEGQEQRLVIVSGGDHMRASIPETSVLSEAGVDASSADTLCL